MPTHEEIVAYAKLNQSKLQGNWKKFEAFHWRDQPTHKPDNWALVYTHTRDSSLIEKMVSDKISEEINKIEQADRYENPTEYQYQEEDHNHWACGWVAGFAIKVVDDVGEFTPAYLKYCECQIKIDRVEFLDELDVYNKMWEGAIENIVTNGQRYVRKDANEPNWVTLVLEKWLAEDENRSVHDNDDNPAWLDDNEIKDLLQELNLLDESYIED